MSRFTVSVTHKFLRRGRRYRTETPAHEPPLAERPPVPGPQRYDHRGRWSAVGGRTASGVAGRCCRPRIHSRGLGSVQLEERQAEWGLGARCREQDRPGCGCGWAAPAATPTPVPFLQHSATLVPAETFSSEFVEPRVRCISNHGAFSPSRWWGRGREPRAAAGRWPGLGDSPLCSPPPSAACLPSRFPKPPQPVVLRDCQVLPLPPGLPLTHSRELTPGAPPPGPQPRPPTAADPDVEPTLLRHPQVWAGAGARAGVGGWGGTYSP